MSWPSGRQKEEERKERKSKPRDEEHRPHTWVEGGKEEDNMRYRAFLLYCEQRRQECRIQQEEDEDRKRRAKAREQHWEMLRHSIKYLKKNETKGWQ